MKGVDESNPPAIPLFEKWKYRFPADFTLITPLLCKESDGILLSSPWLHYNI